MIQGYPGRTFFRFAGTHSINRQRFREEAPFLKDFVSEEEFRKLKKRHQKLLRKGLNRHERLTIRDASGKSFEVYHLSLPAGTFSSQCSETLTHENLSDWRLLEASCCGRFRRSFLHPSRATLGTKPINLKLVIELGVSADFRNFLFQLLHWTRQLENFHRAAVAANQVIMMPTRHRQGEVCRALVQTQSAHEALFAQAVEKTEESGPVADPFYLRRFFDLTQGLGSPRSGKSLHDSLQGLRPPQALRARAV